MQASNQVSPLLRISCIALNPKSRGYVSIRSVDPTQPPVLQPNYLHEEHDLDVIVDAARIAYALANTTVRFR